MPPIKKFRKEDILQAALEIAKARGFEEINARTLAQELGCSVQPIFHNFTNMQGLLRATYEKMYEKYKTYLTPDPAKDKAYKQMGIGYIKFAKDYPEYFKAIFMHDTGLDAETFIAEDAITDGVITAGRELSGLSYEQQKKFHIKVWIFTHGLACLLASGTITMDDDEISSLLENTVREMLIGFKKEEEK